MRSYIILSFLILSFLSCNNTVKNKNDFQQKKVERLSFLKAGDMPPSFQIIIEKNGVFFERLRNGERRILSPAKQRVSYIDQHRGSAILDTVALLFVDSSKGFKIGAPYEYDQGGYELSIMYEDKSIQNISIDINGKEWPKEISPFLNSITELYWEITQKEVR